MLTELQQQLRCHGYCWVPQTHSILPPMFVQLTLSSPVLPFVFTPRTQKPFSRSPASEDWEWCLGWQQQQQNNCKHLLQISFIHSTLPGCIRVIARPTDGRTDKKVVNGNRLPGPLMEVICFPSTTNGDKVSYLYQRVQNCRQLLSGMVVFIYSSLWNRMIFLMGSLHASFPFINQWYKGFLFTVTFIFVFFLLDKNVQKLLQQ